MARKKNTSASSTRKRGGSSGSSGSSGSDLADGIFARKTEIRGAVQKGWHPCVPPGKPQDIVFIDSQKPDNIIEGIPVQVTTDKYDTLPDDEKKKQPSRQKCRWLFRSMARKTLNANVKLFHIILIHIN